MVVGEGEEEEEGGEEEGRRRVLRVSRSWILWE